MAIHMLSDQTIEEAHEMAAQSQTWSRGRSKANGREFWVIPSRSEEGVAHWTTNYGCTCKGARRHGNCAHQEAVRIVEQEQARIDAAIDEALGTVSWDDLRLAFPGCAAGCGQITENRDGFCDQCGAERERGQRMAAARARVLEEWTA